MNWMWVANWFASMVIFALYMNSTDKRKNDALLLCAFVGWFFTAAVLMQQPSSLRGYLNEAKEIVCGAEGLGLASVDSMECKNAIVNAIFGQ